MRIFIVLSLAALITGSPAFSQRILGHAETKALWEAVVQAKRETMGTAEHAMVAACHPTSTQIGLEVLRLGGNAADAFIAATLADYVVAPALTSPAGPLGLLIYEAQQKATLHLHAGGKTPSDPTGLFDPIENSGGKSRLLPGALRGLFELHQKKGRLPWSQVVEPAENLAREGFAVDPLFHIMLLYGRQNLLNSPYARATFFQNDEPLPVGAWLKLPLLAETFRVLKEEGAAPFYQGAWAEEFVREVQDRGGKITMNDMARYQPLWLTPHRGTYRGHEVVVPATPNTGGLRNLMVLNVLENVPLSSMGHWSTHVDSLSLFMKIYRRVQSENWIKDSASLADRAFVEHKLSKEHAQQLWRDVQNDDLGEPQANKGSHSFHVVVVDSDGNIVTGTNTIESIPFGDPAIFVGGIPLNSSGFQSVGHPADSFIPEPLTPYLIFKNGEPFAAGGVFSTALHPGDSQVIANLIDFGMNAEDAVLTPRFGSFLIRYLDVWPPRFSTTHNYLDPRIDLGIVDQLSEQGLFVKNYDDVDTGYPVLIRFNPQGFLEGMTPEFLGGRAEGF